MPYLINPYISQLFERTSILQVALSFMYNKLILKKADQVILLVTFFRSYFLQQLNLYIKFY